MDEDMGPKKSVVSEENDSVTERKLRNHWRAVSAVTL